MIKIYHNNRCSKSRAALQAIQQSGNKFEIIDYLNNAPTLAELKKLISNSEYNVIDFVRTKEKIFVENYRNLSLTDNQLLEILAKHPELLERPIVVYNKKVIIVRDEEKLKEISNWRI
ncbi:MAG: ArsC/Spx/MgsR family protein [Bacteroidota bacterium]